MLPAKTARTRSVGTKLSEEEYARLESLAAQRGLTVGEWVREVVLKAGEPQPASAAEQTLLSEVLALRAIVINTVYDLANQSLIAAGTDGMTPERMKELIAKADAGKLGKALERLKETGTASKIQR
jgi:hypothetical protein